MRFINPTTALIITACLLDTTTAFGWKLFNKKSYNLLGFSPPAFPGNTKRDLNSLPGGSDGLEARDYSPAQKHPLEKREGKSCDCVETETASYGLINTETYMASPFGRCDVRSTASNLCPTDHLCVGQDKTFSRCLPTTIVSNTEFTTYTGPSSQPSITFWWLSSVVKYGADPSGQCGGSTRLPPPAPAWDSLKTDCPYKQACACQEEGVFSVCVDTAAKEFIGTQCPKPKDTCTYKFKNLPPPTATAKIGGQCGGTCWSGPTNCPKGAICHTETSPSPGAYAMCHTVKPINVKRLRLKGRGDEGIHVPARVQALATPIYF
ncbi:hypothetical protein TWF506_009694 [Arthrobotrys conoides]|uniref:CBM1 domain-containing protein n=1 Tax=Arthrobotrys conoides TaxID=74498 RepID=A0AAN8N9W5_9PEZI